MADPIDLYEYKRREKAGTLSRGASKAAPAGYNQSRAALRERYGSQRIDASAPYSAKDTTPSGRLARNMQAGMTEPEAAQRVGQEFAAQFRPRGQIGSMKYGEVPSSGGWQQGPTFPKIGTVSTKYGSVTGQNTAAANFTADVLESQTHVTPISLPPGGGFPTPRPGGDPNAYATPLAFNLGIPSSLSASVLAPYLPNNPAQSYTPPWRKTNTGGYMSSMLQGASKWML